jgi:UDP-galactose transporter B1
LPRIIAVLLGSFGLKGLHVFDCRPGPEIIHSIFDSQMRSLYTSVLSSPTKVRPVVDRADASPSLSKVLKEAQQTEHPHNPQHHHHKHLSAQQSWLKFAGCVGGIYFFFLTWGIVQERISTIAYVDTVTGLSERFRHFQVLTWLQSATAALVALLFLRVQRMPLVPGHIDQVSSLLRELFILSLSSTVASPIGFAALKRLNYPTMVLGKSCKLVPVLLMNMVVGGRRFSSLKYFTVLLITIGVGTFMLWDPTDHSRAKGATSASSWTGLLLLLLNLVFDGIINSWQDQLFVKWRISSQQLMFFMNLFASLIFLTMLVVTLPFTGQLADGLRFLAKYPQSRWDFAAFCICGALGQVFIFLTIELFGSLTLTTVTVTRKLMTILISLVYFEHPVTRWQWLSVSLVFAALLLESFGGGSSKARK